MVWTTTPPTSPGWWWVRHSILDDRPRLVRVTRLAGVLSVRLRFGTFPVEMVVGPYRWAGPIPEPDEPADAGAKDVPVYFGSP